MGILAWLTGKAAGPEYDIASPQHKADPYPFYARLRAHDPVHRVTLPGGTAAWLVTRYDDVVMVLKDDRFAKDRHAALTPRTKAVIINSPTNPTGAVISEEGLGAIADACGKRGIWVIVDLCYEKLIYENVPLSAHILYRVRTTVTVPVLAKLGAFKTPRLLHETATKLAPWASGFVLVHGLTRKVVDDKGAAAFEGAGRERAEVVGAQTFEVASRQVEELLSWRKAGAWDRAILAVGGISTVERATWLLREGADAALVATAALFDPVIATRFRQALSTAVA